MLRSILQETDSAAFHKMLINFVEITQIDPLTISFSNYFKNNYMKNVKSWAYCYRLDCGLNTNMHIERLHRTIKYAYLSGKAVKRLDKSISCLMRLVKDKLFERIIALQKGKLCNKLINLRNRHKRSLEMLIIAENLVPLEVGWNIYSENQIYHIYKKEVPCDVNCSLFCDECEVCIHTYLCTCMDAAIKWNMCKHIHFLCMHLKATREDKIKGDNMQVSDYMNLKDMEAMNILNTIAADSVTQRATSIELRKQKIQEQFKRMLDNVQTEEEICTLEKLIAPIEPTLLAIKAKISDGYQPAATASSKRNIVPQRRLYSTKSLKKCAINKVSKPTAQELDLTAIKLLNKIN